MQRKTTVLLRAARYLETEAREYVDAAKEQPDDAKTFGTKAGVLFGTAYALRQLAATGLPPKSDIEKHTGFAMVELYRQTTKTNGEKT